MLPSFLELGRKRARAWRQKAATGCCGESYVATTIYRGSGGPDEIRHVFYCSMSGKPCELSCEDGVICGRLTDEQLIQLEEANDMAKNQKRDLVDPEAMRKKIGSREFLEALRVVCPKHLTAERLARTALAAMQATPALFECTLPSIMFALRRAAIMGLEPDGGPLGHGYLVPYWNAKRRVSEAKFIPGYRGLIKLARNSGDVLDIAAEVVRDGDEFDYSLGLDPVLKHRPSGQDGELVAPYAVARFRQAGINERKFIVLQRFEVLRIKEQNAPRDQDGKIVGPWVTHEAEQWKKTAIRRLSKYLPLSVEARANFDDDDQAPPAAAYRDITLDAEKPAARSTVESTGAPPDDQSTRQVLEVAIKAIQEAEDKSTVLRAFDEWAGPDGPGELATELAQLELERARDARLDEIAQSRGQASNKKGG